MRTAQMRVKRQQRGSKLFGRAIMIVLVLSLLVAGVLTFGRSRLFPDAWDSALTPIVDQIQQQQEIEFEHPVPLTRQPAPEYALTVSRLLLGDAWLDRVPEWRALGLAAGDPTPEGVGSTLTPRRLAVYDADADRIYMLEGAEATAVHDLRAALEAAYAAQIGRAAPATAGNGLALLGVSAPDLIAQRAVSSYVANVSSPATASTGAIEPTPADPAGTEPDIALPLPIDYEITAVDTLGQPLLISAGVDTNALRFGIELPDDMAQRLDDGAAVTSAGVLQQGERALAEPVALGVDDWSLVWGTRLPADTVAALVGVVGADSYRPFDRGGITCIVGVFETASPTEAGLVLSAMATWAAAGPAQSQPAATSLSETRVQLVTCDPGVNSAVAPPASGVVDLVARQIARLEG